MEVPHERAGAEVEPSTLCRTVKILCGIPEAVLIIHHSIHYEEPEIAEAYSILHFLDRYLRSQYTYRELLGNSLMPIYHPDRAIQVLDMGQGPRRHYMQRLIFTLWFVSMANRIASRN